MKSKLYACFVHRLDFLLCTSEPLSSAIKKKKMCPGEHTIIHTDDELECCIPKTYRILLTVTSIKNKKLFFKLKIKTCALGIKTQQTIYLTTGRWGGKHTFY